MSKASYNIDNFETAIMGEKRLIRFTICLKSKLLLVSSIGHQGAPVAHTSAPHGGGLGPGGAGPEDLRPQTAPGPAAEPTAAPRTQQVKTGEALESTAPPPLAYPQ